MIKYRRKLREIILSLTNRCNLRCAMCQIPENKNGQELTTDEVKALIKDALTLTPHSIVFSGGEPLLRKDIFELISFVSQHNVRSCLTSNGTLLDEETANKLAEAGVNVVNISIEGPEDVHDSLRGKGNYQRALEALKNLSRYKIETTLATLVCRQNYAFLPHVMALAHQWKILTVKFQPFSEIFLIDSEKQKDFFISADAFEDVKRSMEEVIVLSKEYKIATNPGDYLRRLPFYLCGFREKLRRKGCSALWTSCPISATGEVYLCWVLSDKILGNIRDTQLSKIWNSGAHHRLRQQISRQGCVGCLMSCYDHHFEKLGHLLFLKGKRLLGILKNARRHSLYTLF